MLPFAFYWFYIKNLILYALLVRRNTMKEIDTGLAFKQIKKQNGKNVLVPFVDEFIVSVDIENKKIVIDPIEGLIWE